MSLEVSLHTFNIFFTVCVWLKLVLEEAAETKMISYHLFKMCFFPFLVSKGHKLIWLRMERETAISVFL